MKKVFLTLAAAAVFVLPASISASELRLDWQNELAPAKCNPVGDPVINVVEKVKNDADSGQAGNYWAFDNYTRNIKVWNTSVPGTYCATVKYEGEFKAVAGQRSPGNTGILTGKEKGEIKGGRRATIVGALLQNPAWPSKGFVGSYDYQGDVNGNIPGYVSWLAQYFAPGYSYNDDWWGWIYKGEQSGAWINAASGNFGDILWGAKGDKKSESSED